MKTVASDAERRTAWLKQFGSHSQAFATLQPGMAYFELPAIGYVAYATHAGVPFVLSDPVCSSPQRPVLLDRFLEQAPDAVFVQVSKAVVDHLHRRHGFYGTQVGSEASIDLADWSLRGSKKQVIRTAVNQARRQGIDIRESSLPQDVDAISQAWIRTRRCSRGEIGFIIRSRRSRDTEGTRCFYAYRHGEAVGFAFFDPLYRDGRVISYVPSISRASTQFRQGLWYALMAQAIEVFRGEGVGQVHLGLVPLRTDDTIERQESRALRALFALIRRRMDFLYNFAGLEFAKSRFDAAMEKSYCSHRRALPVYALGAFLRLARLL